MATPCSAAAGAVRSNVGAVGAAIEASAYCSMRASGHLHTLRAEAPVSDAVLRDPIALSKESESVRQFAVRYWVAVAQADAAHAELLAAMAACAYFVS